MKKLMALLCMVGCLSIAVAFSEEAAFDQKCPVSGKPAKKDVTADYKGGKVYLCCENCQAAFKKEPAKFAVKANEQLVKTGQAKQTKCPFSGKALNPDSKCTVDGVEVQFCCKNCLAEVTKAKADDQPAMVFSDDAFGKGFEVKK